MVSIYFGNSLLIVNPSDGIRKWSLEGSEERQHLDSQNLWQNRNPDTRHKLKEMEKKQLSHTKHEKKDVPFCAQTVLVVMFNLRVLKSALSFLTIHSILSTCCFLDDVLNGIE